MRAQSAGSAAEFGEDASHNGLLPPKLTRFVEAEYPPEAFDSGREAVVLARLSINAFGKVTAVHLQALAGNGFDEAAKAAMMQFEFTPATRDGKPVACEILYRYRFFVSEKPAVNKNEAGNTAAFETTRTEAATETVSENVTTETVDVETESPSNDDLIAAEETQLAFEVVVRDKRIAPVREVTKQSVTRQEITKVPGTGGDAMRAIQNLPGVATANFMGGELVIRGSSHTDSAFFFDGLATPMLYHFQEMTTVINSDLLDSIDYYPGNFSVRYGRATGGIIDANVRMPDTEAFHGYIDLDVFDGGMLIEGPLSKNWSLAVSGRRSWIDAILKNADAFGDEVQLTVAPRYYDFQIVADYHPGSRDHLQLFAYVYDDRWVMSWDDEPEWANSIDVHVSHYQMQSEWRHRFNSRLENKFEAGVGLSKQKDNEGQMKLKWDIVPVLLRNELTFSPGDNLTFRFGTDTELRWGRLKAYVPGDIYVEGIEYFDAGEPEWLELNGDRFYYYPALYTELTLSTIPRTEIIAGIRGDYYSSIDAATLDPRLVIRYSLFKKTTLKAGAGIFHQVPALEYVDKEYGNPDLKPVRAVHYTVGVEQQLHRNVDLNVDGFYKDLSNVISASSEMIERDGEMVSERFSSDAIGRAYGMEVMLRHKATDRFFGWLSYTLMKSERRDAAGEPWRLFDYDQTHILTAVGSLTLGRGYSLGVRFRLASGKPDDEIVGAGFDADENAYFPIFSGNNNIRMPLFHQLDIRGEKKWQWRVLSLSVYLEIMNVYNRKNPVFDVGNYDFSEKSYVYDLPIIPTLGVKLEM